MKLLVFGGLLLAGLWTCQGGEEEIVNNPACSEIVTVRDLSSLDACGTVLEKEDGTYLLPERRIYVQAPKPEEDPLYFVELKVGQRLRISYQETEAITACMAGKSVFVTCLTEVGTSEN